MSMKAREDESTAILTLRGTMEGSRMERGLLFKERRYCLMFRRR